MQTHEQDNFRVLDNTSNIQCVFIILTDLANITFKLTKKHHPLNINLQN